MNVRVEVGPLTADAALMESNTIVEIRFDVVIESPTVSYFPLTPIISVSGNSISAITPESFRIGVRAA